MTETQRIIERDHNALSPSIQPRIYPLVVKRARGVEVESIDGKTYLDFMAGIAVCTTGHSHPKVVDAITRQAGQFIHVGGTDVYYESQVELAEQIQEISGFGPDGRVFFGNSGTEGIEAAIKLARYHTGKPGIISFVNGFHGRTHGSLGATASRQVQRAGFFVGSNHNYHALYPNSQPLSNQPPISLDFAMQYLSEVVLGKLTAPSEVAAIVVEPVQGEGGYVFPPREFLPQLRRLCDEAGILLIADEVQTGIGRSGRWFAVDHVGVRPDILVMAKGLASGLPISATVADTSVMDWPAGTHANTFGGNPLACAAALSTLEVVEEERLIENAAVRGRELREGLQRLTEAHPTLVQNPRGLGLLAAIDLAGELETAEQQRNALVQEAFHHGLLVLPAGRRAIRLIPPLIVTAEDVRRAIGILGQSLTALDEKQAVTV